MEITLLLRKFYFMRDFQNILIFLTGSPICNLVRNLEVLTIGKCNLRLFWGATRKSICALCIQKSTPLAGVEPATFRLPGLCSSSDLSRTRTRLSDASYVTRTRLVAHVIGIVFRRALDIHVICARVSCPR